MRSRAHLKSFFPYSKTSPKLEQAIYHLSMSKTSNAITSLTATLSDFASLIEKLIEAKSTDNTKLDEANAQIDSLKSQLLNSVDDEETAQSLETLSDNLKAVAAKALATVSLETPATA